MDLSNVNWHIKVTEVIFIRIHAGVWGVRRLRFIRVPVEVEFCVVVFNDFRLIYRMHLNIVTFTQDFIIA